MSDARFDSDTVASSGRGASIPRLILFGAAGAVAVAFGFLAYGAREAGLLVQRYGYVVMLATFLWWAASLVWRARARRGEGPGWRDPAHRPAWWMIAALSVSAWMIFPYSTKVLYDEAVLQSSAWSIHHFREFGTAIRNYEIEGVFRSLEVYVDKRPFVYPFAVSLVHDLTGYRPVNAFLLNSALLPVCLAMLYLGLCRFVSTAAARAGLVCAGASVLLAQNANGAGMELLNLTLLTVTLWLAMDYVSRPEERSLSALVLSAVLLAQARYESALYVAPVAVVILLGWWRAGRVLLPPAALAAPLLLIPCALHNTYLAGTPILWELRENMESRFALEHLAPNLGHAARFFFDFGGTKLNSWWLYACGFAALAALALVAWRRRREWRATRPEVTAWLCISLATTGNLGLLMFYFWGQLDDPIVSRLILPFNVLLAGAIALAVDACASPAWRPRIAAGLIAGASLVYVAFGGTAAAHLRNINDLATEIAWEETWLAEQPAAARLMITNKSAIPWVLRRQPAISIALAGSRGDQIGFHLRHGTFQEVLVSQYYRPTTPEGDFVLDPRDGLPERFVLQPVTERRMGGRLLRISRVTEVRPAAPRAANLAETPTLPVTEPGVPTVPSGRSEAPPR